MASIPRLFYSLGIHIAETRSIGHFGDAIVVVFFMGVLSGMLEKPRDTASCGYRMLLCLQNGLAKDDAYKNVAVPIW